MTDEQIADCKPTMGKGCKLCNETGFKGRVALYEVMAMNDGIKEAVLQGYSAMELKKEAIALGMQTLRQSAIHKLMDGTTTISEILRTTRADNA
jgi:type IV pilus assembly protein PilB